MSMTDKIFLNLPVRDVAKATAFYETLGATKNPLFSNENASSMVFSDHIHVMLLSHEFFGGFIPGRTIADANGAVGMIICVTQDSRGEVDALVEKAGAAGGVADITPADDYGFMYGRNFADLDGHLWNIVWMDPVAAEKGPEAMAAA